MKNCKSRPPKKKLHSKFPSLHPYFPARVSGRAAGAGGQTAALIERSQAF